MTTTGATGRCPGCGDREAVIVEQRAVIVEQRAFITDLRAHLAELTTMMRTVVDHITHPR